MVALASAIAIPFGIGVALYLVEYGKDKRFANAVRYFVDVMTGVPSIVFGLFVYIVLVVDEGRRDVRGLEGLRRARAAHAARRHALRRGRAQPRARQPARGARSRSARRAGGSSFRIVLPTALPGLVTGSLLAVARAAGETAPLLFTAAFVFGTQYNLSQRMNSLPLQIFNDVGQAQDRLVQRAWGAALTLVVLVLLLTLCRPPRPAKEPPLMTPEDETTPAAADAHAGRQRRHPARRPDAGRDRGHGRAPGAPRPPDGAGPSACGT